MNTNNQTIRDLTIAYVENALAEVSLLHDTALIEPTLKQFHIERHNASMFKKFSKPRLEYTVTDVGGTPLGGPIRERDLGPLYTGEMIERQIAANLDSMLADHADLIALHRAGDGGAAPSFRYKPASSLAERTDTEAALENQKTNLRESIEQLHEQQQAEQQRLHSILHQQKAAEMKLEDVTRKTRQMVAQAQQAQKTIDREQRIRERDARRRGVIPSPWETETPEQENGPEFA